MRMGKKRLAVAGRVFSAQRNVGSEQTERLAVFLLLKGAQPKSGRRGAGGKWTNCSVSQGPFVQRHLHACFELLDNFPAHPFLLRFSNILENDQGASRQRTMARAEDA